ncbi:sterol desaturase family protein [Hyphococcus sp.]|uniref:sterol desaturase family protein n=1 Tax=Hyphococcus sp. TaxID=2038636 RepID=UPI0035C71DCA
MRLFIGYKAWKEEDYLLNRMTFDDLVKAYVTYPAIQVYAVIVVAALVAGIATIQSIPLFLLSFVIGGLMFPIAWYFVHRFILHGSWMYKTPFLAGLWKRIHFDHHLYPNDLSVLFGGLHTTLPTIFFVAGPVGWLIGGPSCACAAVAGTVIMTMYTEFLHAGEHLAFEPKSKFWKDMKRRHLAHHFHNEKGNYGIAEFFWDRRFGTFYDQTADAPRTATARNLGYTDEMAQKYPWVKDLTEAEPKARRAMRSGGAAS